MNDPANDPTDPASLLPQDIAACHALIHQLRIELAQTRRKLSVHEQNEKSRMEYLYGNGATAEHLLNFGRLIAGDDRAVAPGDPADPTVGELYLRQRAARRKARNQKKKESKKDNKSIA
jgi:hypothetical protein